MLKFLKRMFCIHEYRTETNIYGDLINSRGCRSIRKCVKCGKTIQSKELDKNCKIANWKRVE